LDNESGTKEGKCEALCAQKRQLRDRNGSWHKGKTSLGKYLRM
jgi:hypothetical protein